MSRCFPFPPPGYESKAKANDLELLLKKEKHKEKKHKKEKRDKDKKEGKEKHEKERTDEKRREKKDKKEKSRDKKKDKEKDGNKDKHKSDSSCPDEKRVVGPSGGLLAMPSEKSKDRENDRNAILAEKKVAGVSTFRNGEQISKNNFRAPEIKSNPLAPETKSSRYGPELAQRSYDGERRSINQLPDKIVGMAGKKADEVARLVGKSAGPLVDGKEKSKEKAGLDVQGVVGETRSSGDALVPNSVGLVHIRVGGSARPMEKKAGPRVEGKEKIREKEGDDRKGDKWKDREKQIHRDKDREKEKKKEEKVKVKSEQKHIEQPRIKDSSDNHMLKLSVKDGIKKEFTSAPNAGVQKLPKDNHHVVATNNLGKRKDIGLNGIDDEHSTGPHKLARTMASPHPLTENGRSLDPCQNSTVLAPGTQRPPMNIKVDRTFAPDDTQRPPTNIKVDGKERKINGIISQPVSQQPSQTSAKAKQKSVPPSKPPHPDTKYLSQVLSVPKLDDWSDTDDQDWLFNSTGKRTLEAESSDIDKTPQQVWAKALWLEPVDVYALPYVIPY